MDDRRQRMSAFVGRLAARLEAIVGAPVAAIYVGHDEPIEAPDLAAEQQRRDEFAHALRQTRVDLLRVLRSLDELDEANALDDAAADGVTRGRLHALEDRVADLARRVDELAAQLGGGMG